MIAARLDRDGKELPLQAHLEETAALAQAFARPIGLENFGYALGLLHDLGKLQSAFQEKLRANDRTRKVDHSGAAALYFQKLQLHKDPKFNETLTTMLGLISASHHGGLLNVYGESGRSDYEDRLKRAKENIAPAQEEEDAFLSFARLPDLEWKTFNRVLETARSSEKHADFIYLQETLIVKYFFSCLVDADRIHSSGVSAAQYEEYGVKPGMASCVDARVRAFPTGPLSDARNAIYRAVCSASEKAPGLYELDVPTGGGKTLSALRFALRQAEKYGKKRVIFVLPYLSIIEQNAREVRRTLGAFPDAVLECHSNVVREDVSDGHAEGWETGERGYRPEDNYNAPVVFTTMVQFLENVYGDGTKGIRRFHAYAESILVFDEIQTLPLKCCCLFNALIRFLTTVGQSGVVLCSATPPALDRLGDKNRPFQLPAPQKLVGDAGDFSVFERMEYVDLTVHATENGRRAAPKMNEEEMRKLIGRQLEEFRSVLVICNTKSTARKIYGALTGVKKVYLSTDLCAEDRLQRIDDLKRRNPEEPVVCVSTQLVEAGVDLDFDCVIRCLAGADNLVQAAGRCNREGKLTDADGRPRRGRVLAVRCLESLGMLPEIEDAAQYMTEVSEQSGLPYCGRAFIDRYYQKLYANNEKKLRYPFGKDLDLNLVELLGNNKRRTNNKETYIKQSFRDAAREFHVIDNRQIGVLVPFGKGRSLIERLDSAHPDYTALKEAQRYTVNVYESAVDRMPGKIRAICNGTVLIAQEGAYDDELGLFACAEGKAILY